MVRTREGGSVLSFVVIGIVLVALFVGGIYGLQQLIPQPEPNQPGGQSDAHQQAQDPENGAQGNDRPDTAAPSEETSDAASTPETGASSELLPQSGPANTIASAFMMGVIGFVIVAYLRSRRQTDIF